jgi:hypothetical protein
MAQPTISLLKVRSNHELRRIPFWSWLSAPLNLMRWILILLIVFTVVFSSLAAYPIIQLDAQAIFSIDTGSLINSILPDMFGFSSGLSRQRRSFSLRTSANLRRVSYS